MKALVLLAVLVAALSLVSPALARPRPEPAPDARHKITWVAYRFKDPGKDAAGHRYWRWCHVSKSDVRTCGHWHRGRA